MVRDEFAYLDFDDKGRFKEPEHEKEESSAFDMLDFFSLKQQDKRVIDVRHKFARKRYFDKNRWQPTDEIITAIAEAIFGKLIWRWFYTVKQWKNYGLPEEIHSITYNHEVYSGFDFYYL